MSENKEFKITKEQILAGAEKCPQAKDILRVMFPDAFDGEWEDVTHLLIQTIDHGRFGFTVKGMSAMEPIWILSPDKRTWSWHDDNSIPISSGTYKIFDDGLKRKRGKP